MEYWQFKVNQKLWDENFGDEYSNLSVGYSYPQSISKNAIHKPKNNIDDIVFIYNTKKNATQKYPQGVYLVCKIIENINEDNEIKLEVIKDLRNNPIKPEEFGFQKIMQKIDKLSQNGTYYKFEEEDNPQELYNLIMNFETDNLLPEQLDDEDIKKLTEGAKKQIVVNAHERNPKAREECIKKYGLSCTVCGFNFEEVYGNIGKGFIHVHHLREISTIGQSYEVDPIKDLRPVCPNCHAMLHRRKTPVYSIEEMKEIIGK